MLKYAHTFPKIRYISCVYSVQTMKFAVTPHVYSYRINYSILQNCTYVCPHFLTYLLTLWLCRYWTFRMCFSCTRKTWKHSTPNSACTGIHRPCTYRWVPALRYRELFDVVADSTYRVMRCSWSVCCHYRAD